MGARSRFETAITAEDETASGVKSADKRFKKLYENNNRYAAHSAKAVRSSGLGAVAEAFGQIEKAASRILGTKSVTATLGDRLGGIGKASRFASAEMEGAARSGSILKTAMTGVTLAGAGTVGVLAAAGVAAVKMVTSFSASGAQLGRLSASLGIATRDLQAFQGAAERAGVSKEASAGALGGIGSSIHGAVYGQNPEALAALNKLGIPIRRNPDGTVDILAMTLALADATSRIKDPYAQQHLASIFGYQEALPAMRQGSRVLGADMADMSRIRGIMSDSDVARGSRIQRNLVTFGQMGQGVNKELSGGMAAFGESGINGVVQGARRLGEGAGLFDRSVTNRFAPAVDRLAAASTMQAVGGGPSAGGSLASRIEHQESRGRQSAVSSKGALGVMQLMPETARAAAGRLGVPFDPNRLRTDEAYNRALGHEELRYLLRRYDGDEMLASAAYNAGPGAVDRWIAKFGDPRRGEISRQDFAAKIPYGETRDYVSKVGAAPQPAQRLIHEFRGLPTGTTVITRNEGTGDVAIGRAMPPGP